MENPDVIVGVFTLSGNYTCVDVYSLQENMMTQLYRTQVLLERRQHESLQQLAAAEGRSMSEVIREAVAKYLVDHSKERKKQQALDAIAKLSELRDQLVAEHGIFEGDLLDEAREERDQDMERVWRGEA